MSKDVSASALSNLPGIDRARSEDSCVVFENGAAILDGISMSDGGSGGLLSMAATLGLREMWVKKKDIVELMSTIDRTVFAIEDVVGARRGGAAACVVRKTNSGRIELANVGDTNAAIVGRSGSAFLFQPSRDDRGRIYNYLGSGRCMPKSIERYNLTSAADDLFVVLLTDGAWEYLPLPFIRCACLESNGCLLAAATSLTAEARKRGSRDDASAIVLKIG